MTEYHILIHLPELCDELDLPRDACLELVEHGLIQPQGERPDDWAFDVTTVSVVRRAVRLQRDLDLDWSTVALVVSLLEERDELRTELKALKQRLSRFLDD